jgi:hypothetical protein
MLVVADSSALLALAACDSLTLLDALFEEVRVPGAVFRECTVQDKPYTSVLRSYLQGRVDDVDLMEFVVAASGLGRGELEAMALYKRLRADRLLIDDGRARRVARINDVDVIGSLGVLILAKSRNIIPAVSPLLDRIKAAGNHLSDELVSEALRLSGEA